MTKKIVVVDDEEDLCVVLKAMLEQHGFQAQTACDGLAGKQLVERVKPDLLILDIKMPRMNGYELMFALRQNPRFKDLPMIVLTSLTEDSPKTDAQWRESLGVAEFLSKPFEIKELIGRVERILAAPGQLPSQIS